MKHLIATALILTAGVAQAQSFDHEKQIGSADLFSTLATEGVVSTGGGEFAYQEAIGSSDLFPTLGVEQKPAGAPGNRTVFEYQLNIGSSELDPHLS